MCQHLTSINQLTRARSVQENDITQLVLTTQGRPGEPRYVTHSFYRKIPVKHSTPNELGWHAKVNGIAPIHFGLSMLDKAKYQVCSAPSPPLPDAELCCLQLLLWADATFEAMDKHRTLMQLETNLGQKLEQHPHFSQEPCDRSPVIIQFSARM